MGGLHFQRVAMVAVHQNIYECLVADAGLPFETRARLRAAAAPVAGAWCTIESVRDSNSYQEGNALDDFAFAVAVRKRLGHPHDIVTEDSRCTCQYYNATALPTVPGVLRNTNLNVSRSWHQGAYHFEGCACNQGRNIRHHALNVHIARGMRCLGCSARVTEVPLCDQPRVRGDIFGRDPLGGTFVGDGTVWSSMRLEDLRAVARGTLDVAAKAEALKVAAKEKYCKTRKWSFLAFAFNAFGGMGAAAYKWFSERFEKKRDAAVRAGEPEWAVINERKKLYEDISASIQRHNATMLTLNCVNPGGQPAMPPAPIDLDAQHGDH